MNSKTSPSVDVLLIGAGVMSATTGALLHALEPALKMMVLERLEDCALESSMAWNNAGTGHAANCELNYTPQLADGSIDISEALKVNTEFDVSREFWAHLVKAGAIPDPRAFLHPCPHMSFVWGDENVTFLKARHAAMSAHHCYRGMEYTEDHAQIATWAPLVMKGRDPAQRVAATRLVTGTDVDYGALTGLLIQHLGKESIEIRYNSEVLALERDDDKHWAVTFRSTTDGVIRTVSSRFVFIGAGGAAISLLQKSGIPEAKGYGGFPVSGIWLRCDVEGVAAEHHAKVYGKASSGSPPMSVPHLDTRIVDGKTSLLFGPYAGFSTKFLKHGSHTDLFESVTASNIQPLLSVAKANVALEEYLIGQVLQSTHHQFEMLQAFYPTAQRSQWKEAVAGQRVQIIKPDADDHGGKLVFGTELVAAADKSLVALLGASPGASTAAAIAVQVLHACFAERLTEAEWLPKLRTIFPTYGIDLIQDAAACDATRAATATILKIDNVDA
ncbi:malate dehydrogenase (quinone) [Luteibacter pinisoli]|uniref:Probable malate:quinone oxidoreductase n=1 Tax=Luteibacter pinisoli TaxID=2589080 RepID=A0A4Y5Z320_9GAMM|nr:malate dehydrogenase (quinone) [Luteibacter pinisoli]QDE39752.1 malate dehydrogenase (quinone) [Luteibacter pinisoli]